jgi:hypothetical protein
MTRFPLSAATRLSDRQIVWISAADNAKNGDGRPSQFVHWGVSSAVLAAQYAETHASDLRPVKWEG